LRGFTVGIQRRSVVPRREERSRTLRYLIQRLQLHAYARAQDRAQYSQAPRE
jgi:hypothetical protein